MKRINPFTIAVLTLFALVPSLSAASKTEVEIEDFAFVPKSVTIFQGDTVVWKNRDNVGHTSTSGESGVPNGLWDSGILGRDQTFSRVSDSAGTFPYYCKPHPIMTGTVVVEPRPDTTDSTPAVIIENNDEPVPQLKVEAGVVKFSVIERGPVDVTIYDATGRQMELVVRGFFTSGVHSLPMKPLERGVYFARLVSGEYVVTRKIIQL